jgi:hypothetical protein
LLIPSDSQDGADPSERGADPKRMPTSANSWPLAVLNVFKALLGWRRAFLLSGRFSAPRGWPVSPFHGAVLQASEDALQAQRAPLAKGPSG